MSDKERRVTMNAKIELIKKKLVYVNCRRLRTKNAFILIALASRIIYLDSLLVKISSLNY